jgi:hypothetical protein
MDQFLPPTMFGGYVNVPSNGNTFQFLNDHLSLSRHLFEPLNGHSPQTLSCHSYSRLKAGKRRGCFELSFLL